MAPTIQIPAEGRASQSAGERKSARTSQDTSQPKSSAAATATRGLDSETRSIEQHSPEHHEIALLAYSYWEDRGYEHGSAEEDWLRAERHLRERYEPTTVEAKK